MFKIESRRESLNFEENSRLLFHFRLCAVVHVLFHTLSFLLANESANKEFSIPEEVEEETAKIVLHLVLYFAEQRVTINKANSAKTSYREEEMEQNIFERIGSYLIKTLSEKSPSQKYIKKYLTNTVIMVQFIPFPRKQVRYIEISLMKSLQK